MVALALDGDDTSCEANPSPNQSRMLRVESPMTSCPACRANLPDDARFCGVCGFRLGPTTAELAAQAAQAPASRSIPAHRTGESPRLAPRFPLKVGVDYASPHNFYTGFLENISSGGIFIATHELAAIGEALEVTFTVPGLQRECTVVCKVRWLRESGFDNPDAPTGMGCQFEGLDEDVRNAIETFLQNREPIFYDD